MGTKSARKIFSENLQRLMRNKNVDQKELAEAIGVTQPTISNWIKEVKYPRIKRRKFCSIQKSNCCTYYT